MASNQIPVIMNVSFADQRSYDFCCNGLVTGGTIATGSLGTIKNPESRRTFTQGLATVLQRLKPNDLILYGTASDEVKAVCDAFEVKLHVFSPKWDASFITTKMLYG